MAERQRHKAAIGEILDRARAHILSKVLAEKRLDAFPNVFSASDTSNL